MRMAAARTRGSVSFSFSIRKASSADSKPSSVQSACSRAMGFSLLVASCLSAGTTDLSLLMTISFCAVSRHQPLGSDRCATSLRRRFLQHVRLLARRHAVIDQRADPAAVDVLIEPIFLDLRPKVRAFLGPGGFLNDAVIHVADIEASVRPGGGPDGAEVGIERRDEFLVIVSVGQKPHCRPGRSTLARRMSRPTGSGTM